MQSPQFQDKTNGTLSDSSWTGKFIAAWIQLCLLCSSYDQGKGKTWEKMLLNCLSNWLVLISSVSLGVRYIVTQLKQFFVLQLTIPTKFSFLQCKISHQDNFFINIAPIVNLLNSTANLACVILVHVLTAICECTVHVLW